MISTIYLYVLAILSMTYVVVVSMSLVGQHDAGLRQVMIQVLQNTYICSNDSERIILSVVEIREASS